MSEHVVEKEIAHLDFSVEEKRFHFRHPIEKDLYWCGKRRDTPVDRHPGLGPSAADPSEVTCVDCLHLYIEKGGEWWWRVNRAWYGG